MEYFDTSLLVPFYCPEVHSLAAERALVNSSQPCISLLSQTEFSSALSLKLRMGQIDIATAHRILGEFENHLVGGYYSCFPMRATEIELARDWIAQFSTPLRTLDALHLAIAHTNGCELLTADKGLDKSAKILHVSCSLVV